MILIEQKIDRLETILKAELSAKITALNTAYNDGITLEDIQEIYIEDAEDKTWSAPSLWIIERDPDKPVQASSVMEVAYYIDVYAYATALSLREAKRRCWRYRQAVAEIMVGHRKESGDWDSLRLQQADPQPYHPVGDGWGTSKGVRFLITNVENY